MTSSFLLNPLVGATTAGHRSKFLQLGQMEGLSRRTEELGMCLKYLTVSAFLVIQMRRLSLLTVRTLPDR
jgi:hypothetical protein